MIWDSVPWKQEIERRASSLRRRKKQKRWGAASVAKLEQDVFYAAFAARKLIHSFKISDEVESITIVAEKYPPTKKVTDVMNWHQIDELYDLSKKELTDFALRANAIKSSIVLSLSPALMMTKRAVCQDFLSFRIIERMTSFTSLASTKS